MYQANDYAYLLGMPGFSTGTLQQHFKLYQGYVNNTNLLWRQMQETEGVCSSELRRRFSWEFSGMRLHEYYFENLGGAGEKMKESELMQFIDRCFGSFSAWRRDFTATGLMRGVGWAVLFRDNRSGGLVNAWIGGHDHGCLAGAQPLLVMDVWEHAYLCDYGLERKMYVEAFFHNIHWENVAQRFRYIAV